jgi:hypothetical protein
MLIRLFSDSLFDLPGQVLNLSGILFSAAIRFHAGILGNVPDFLLDCTFDFVKLV